MEDNIDNLKNMLKTVGKECSYQKICEFNDEEKTEYIRMF